MAAAAADEEIAWRFSQVKGSADDDVTEADIISAVEFNENGSLLATGDKGGRIVIFQRDQSVRNTADYNVYCTFQSHEAEFDYLKSLEIEEKINEIRWLRQPNHANFLLATNDKTVKLWKIVERSKRAVGFNTVTDAGVMKDAQSITSVQVPRFTPTDTNIEAIPKRIFANAHGYHINSVSLNSDNATFMSADDLRINLWHIDNNMESFNILDIKPANMEELTEVITAAEFHPNHAHEFVYSISKGAIRLCDMRDSALCDNHSKVFEEPQDPSSKSFFSEIIASISDVRYSHDGRYLLSRDYLTVKVWDVKMERKPVHTFQVHDYLRSQLCPLYENDCIFDKFQCCWSGNDTHIMTGSYNNFFRVFNVNTGFNECLEASREAIHATDPLQHRVIANNPSSKRGRQELSVESIDFNRKVLHSSWHPREKVVAVAATNNLFIFQGWPAHEIAPPRRGITAPSSPMAAWKRKLRNWKGSGS